MVARLAASLAALAALAVPVVAHAAPAPAGARVVACHRSPTIDERVAVVGTWMRPIPGGTRLAVKIDLFERPAGQRWTLRSDVPDLGAWTTPSDASLGASPGDVFKYRQAVGRLEVPAAYRFRASFRWLAPDGTVVREASRTTGVCRQPDLRPDLVLLSVSALPAGGDMVRYTVRVGNEGKGAVARGVVAATFPGDPAASLRTRTLRALAPGATAVVRFTGPGCAAGELPPSFLADPSNALDEADEANNALAAVCPAP